MYKLASVPVDNQHPAIYKPNKPVSCYIIDYKSLNLLVTHMKENGVRQVCFDKSTSHMSDVSFFFTIVKSVNAFMGQDN